MATPTRIPYLSSFTGELKKNRLDGRPTRTKKIPSDLYNKFVEVIDDRVDVEPDKKQPIILIFITDTGKIRFDTDKVQEELHPIACSYKQNYETDLDHVLEDTEPEEEKKTSRNKYQKEFDDDETVNDDDEEDYDDTKEESEYEYEDDEDDEDESDEASEESGETVETEDTDSTEPEEDETEINEEDETNHQAKKQKLEM